MSTAQQIAELERERAERVKAIEFERARISGIDAEIAYLRSGTSLTVGFQSIHRTEAILQVVRAHGSAMTPTQIRERLAVGGREDSLNTITSTLHHLVEKGALTKLGRGSYQLS